MNTYQYRFIRSELSFNQSNMFQSITFLTERYKTEMSKLCRHIYFYTFFYQ